MRTVDAAAILAAMRAEAALLGELCDALATQRDGIAADDSAVIESATHRVSRAVLTLDEARRRREQLSQILAGGDAVPLDRLEESTGPIPGLAPVRVALRAAAQATVRDLALNQAILRGALRAGEAYLQALFSSVADKVPAYTATANPRTPRGVVVNRRA
ncbi:MAG TPA: hypothetical protein VGL65_07725 [Gemmatimonadales bacterium]